VPGLTVNFPNIFRII